jgi:hypothetical protein
MGCSFPSLRRAECQAEPLTPVSVSLTFKSAAAFSGNSCDRVFAERNLRARGFYNGSQFT